MKNAQDTFNVEEAEFFEISAVARLTGISSHVLRVWERRYGVVEPRRSDTKRRQYTQSDIQRLSLLKTLVDNGHAIGSVAKLDTDQLEERLSNALDARASSDQLEEMAPAGVCRVGLVGVLARQAVREASDTSPALSVVGEFKSLSDMTESLRPGAIDLIILERDIIFAEDIAEIQSVVETMKVRRAILIYQFAREDVIQPLDIRKITALRGPVDAAEIQLACIADIQLALKSGSRTPDPAGEKDKDFDRPETEIPTRQFSSEDLVQISKMSAVVKCECPQHLAGLLSSLFAFERYSKECEDRNADDASMHAYLHETTAKARSEMETALQEVMDHEGISL